MRLVVFKEAGSTARLGELSPDGLTVFPLDARGALDTEGVLVALDEQGGTLPLARTAESPLAYGSVALLAPVPRPRRNVFCIGKNYHAHVREFAQSGYDASVSSETAPEAPIVFSKLPQSVIGHGEAIQQDGAASTETDYEAELGVIIGRGGRHLTADAAMAHVWGYTIINDVTARDVQKRHKQWLLGKSQDTFCPMGPCFVTRDEIDLTDTVIRCWVNDELRQDANTGMMIFDVPTLIATISCGITLQPGDVIATGTPSGVGVGFKPPRWLVPGDRVRIEIGGIGTLENPVVAR